MPSEVSKVEGSPLPSVTPPRLMSPVKSRLTKESQSKLSEPMTPDEFVNDVADDPRNLEDISLSEKEPVSLFINMSHLKQNKQFVVSKFVLNVFL